MCVFQLNKDGHITVVRRMLMAYVSAQKEREIVWWLVLCGFISIIRGDPSKEPAKMTEKGNVLP